MIGVTTLYPKQQRFCEYLALGFIINIIAKTTTSENLCCLIVGVPVDNDASAVPNQIFQICKINLPAVRVGIISKGFGEKHQGWMIRRALAIITFNF